jgi:hypothetical protein
VLRQRRCGLNQILRNQIRHFIPETQNRRGLDSYQGTFRANNVLQQFYIADRQPSRIAQETLGNLGAAAVHVVCDDDLVAQPVEQPHGLNTNIVVVEVRKLVAKEKDASIRKRAPLISVNSVPPPQRNSVEFRY